MNYLHTLCIGSIEREFMDADFTFGMDSIGDSLTENFGQLSELWEAQETSDFIRFAPLCARLVLEQSMAIVLGRFDPIRFVALVKGAESGDFTIGQQNPSSFNWTRDVFPDVVPPQAGWWSQKALGKEILRTVLHGQLADYLFNSAHQSVIADLTDFTANLSELPTWVAELLGIEQGGALLARLRTVAKESYSSLSKGIHFEFLKGHSTSLTKQEVSAAVSGALVVASTVGLYSHFTDIALQRSSRLDVLQSFVGLSADFDQ